MISTTLRLGILFLLLGLTASRFGLVLHELLGHYGVARAFGCRLGELELFLFGGGWVSYDCATSSLAQELATDLGGIALELGLGALLYAIARRRDGLLGLALASLGLLYVVHGAFYLVTGVHDGVGDGRTLHRLLGGARAPLVALGSAALVAACFAFARDFARRAAPSVAAFGPAERVGAVAAAVFLACAAHGGLMLAERAWAQDEVYAASFTSEREVAIEAELRRFEVEQKPTPEQVAAQRARIQAAQPQPFPLVPVLGAGMALAALAGLALVLRADTEAQRSPWRLGAPALACALSLAAVLVLDRLL
jgi:hypothetical protein